MAAKLAAAVARQNGMRAVHGFGTCRLDRRDMRRRHDSMTTTPVTGKALPGWHTVTFTPGDLAVTPGTQLVALLDASAFRSLAMTGSAGVSIA
jgi:hypothetical protein